jgi:hypothetical protein
LARIDVVERDRVIGFGKQSRPNLARHDLAKNAVIQVFLLAQV